MNIKIFQKYSLIAQIILWLLWAMLLFLTFIINSSWEKALGRVIVLVPFFMVFVFIHYRFLIDQFAQKEKYWQYLLGVLILVIFFSNLLDYIGNHVLSTGHSGALVFKKNSGRFIVLIFMLTFSGLFKFVELWVQKVGDQAILQNQKLEAELKFLKTQINPHFLFNTLNNIYTLSYMKDDAAAPMVEKLSEIMRYMLYDCKEERVALAKEVTLLQNFVDMQQLKYDNPHNIEFHAEGISSHHTVAPLILINFLENAFKHSDLETNPNGFVHFWMEAKKGEILSITVSNSIRNTKVPNSKSGGIGIENARRQLDINYQQQYTLETDLIEQVFYVNLELPLEIKK